MCNDEQNFCQIVRFMRFVWRFLSAADLCYYSSTGCMEINWALQCRLLHRAWLNGAAGTLWCVAVGQLVWVSHVNIAAWVYHRIAAASKQALRIPTVFVAPLLWRWGKLQSGTVLGDSSRCGGSHAEWQGILLWILGVAVTTWRNGMDWREYGKLRLRAAVTEQSEVRGL